MCFIWTDTIYFEWNRLALLHYTKCKPIWIAPLEPKERTWNINRYIFSILLQLVREEASIVVDQWSTKIMCWLVCFDALHTVFDTNIFISMTNNAVFSFGSAAHCIKGGTVTRQRFVLDSVRLGENDLRSNNDCQEVRESVYSIAFSIRFGFVLVLYFDSIVCSIHGHRANVLVPYKIFQLRNPSSTRITFLRPGHRNTTLHCFACNVQQHSPIIRDRFVYRFCIYKIETMMERR